MAVDLDKMIKNLLDFYDFKDKVVLSIGAGGGQFYEYAFATKHVIAVDQDLTGLESLKACIEKENLSEKFTLIHSDFYKFKEHGDVVMFDFCLHEIPQPEQAILRALTMSPEVLINDHWPESEWAYLVDEDEKVRKSWEAIKKFKVRKIQRFDTFQSFQDYDELFNKVKVQGNNSIKRIQQYKGRKHFNIPMSYGLVLI